MKAYELVTHDEDGKPMLVIELPDEKAAYIEKVAEELFDAILQWIEAHGGNVAGGLDLQEIES